MKQLKRNTFILLLALTWLMSLTIANAESSRIYLSAEGVELTAGQEFRLDVLVENIPPIYGADVRLLFDPAVLEVIGLEAGSFIDPEQGFVLQEQFDNQDGSIDYALTLRNPAPPVEGSGRLAGVIFRAKAANQTTIRLEQGQFGTQDGAVIEPTLAEEFNVPFAETLRIEPPQPPPGAIPSLSPPSPTNSTLLILLAALGGGVVVAGGQFLLSRLRKRG